MLDISLRFVLFLLCPLLFLEGLDASISNRTGGERASVATTGAPTTDRDDHPATVLALAERAGSFRTLTACVEAAGLSDALSGDGPFTVFAPCDAAFDRLGTATIAELLIEPGCESLRNILRLHVVPGRIDAGQLGHLKRVTSLGGRLAVEKRGHDLFVGGAKVVATDKVAGNGIVHVLDGVILPPRAPDLVDLAGANRDFETLLTAVRAAGLEEALRGDGPFTVFAPSDKAFAKLPDGALKGLLKPENRDALAEILKLHVVAGRFDARELLERGSVKTLAGETLAVRRDKHALYVGDARVTTANASARNGIVHVLDRVLLPAKEEPGVLDVARGAEAFGTLLAAIDAAGLTDALSGEGPFTVLAPTDEAFAALGDDAIAALLRPENREKLQRILKLHVIPGAVTARAAITAASAKTLAGDRLQFGIVDGRLRVDVGQGRFADVSKTDIEARNGVVHVLDRVLLPGRGDS